MKKKEKREKREVPVVAAVVLVCLPADKPQGSHGTFEAGTRAEGREEEGGKERGKKKMRKGGRGEEEEKITCKSKGGECGETKIGG